MAEKLWCLPQLTINFINSSASAEKVQLVIAGGRRPDPSWLQQAAEGKNIYCADKGIEYCHEAGLQALELYGDEDSGSQAAYLAAAQSGTRLYRFPPAKDDTDLQLVLGALPMGTVLATGIWGGRFDHLYSNIYSLLSHKLSKGVQVCLADEQEVMLLLGTAEAVGIELKREPLALSLLPLTPAATVSLDGAQWPLEGEQLTMLHPYAISNIPQRQFTCSCTAGAVGLYLSFAK